MAGNTLKAYSYYRAQSQQNWLKQTRYMQAMIAIALQRTDDIKTAKNIIASLKQNAIVNEELGMYWKDVRSGYYWHQAPVETQSVLIEAFAEITKDQKAVTDMKTWLLKQKQTQGWSTTSATADACYALLISVDGNQANSINELFTENPSVEIRLGSTTISSTVENMEAGSGYFKKTFTDEQVKPSMGNIQVRISPSKVQPGKTGSKEAASPVKQPRTKTQVNNLKQMVKIYQPGVTNFQPQENNLRPGVTNFQHGGGAVYWQYFENLDQVTSANGSIADK